MKVVLSLWYIVILSLAVHGVYCSDILLAGGRSVKSLFFEFKFDINLFSCVPLSVTTLNYLHAANIVQMWCCVVYNGLPDKLS